MINPNVSALQRGPRRLCDDVICGTAESGDAEGAFAPSSAITDDAGVPVEKENKREKVQQLLQAAAKGASVTWNLHGLGGHVYQVAVGRPFGVGEAHTGSVEAIALGCGDSTLRLWLPRAAGGKVTGGLQSLF